jgi:hypothetical protein
MRARAAYLAVLITGFTLVAVALHGMTRVDTTLRLAAAHSAPPPEPAPHHHGGGPGCDERV